MHFTCSVDIDVSRTDAVALFLRQDSRSLWQSGLERIEPISGTPGAVGAKSRLVFRTGRGRMELIETILVSRMPEEWTALYEHTHMVNTMSNRFCSIDDQRTRYDAEIEYTQFNGFVPRLMARLMPGMFKTQTQRMLDRFKTLAESRALAKA
jgi:hypothetical protein